MNNNEVKECEFYEKVFMGSKCNLFKSACYGKHCNFHKEFIKLAQYEQQILQLKAENEQLKKEKDYHFKQSAMYLAQKTILGNANDTKLEIIQSLTQKLEKAREALENINKVKLYNMPIVQGLGEKNYLKWYDAEHDAGLDMQKIAQQALKELNT